MNEINWTTATDSELDLLARYGKTTEIIRLAQEEQERRWERQEEEDDFRRACADCNADFRSMRSR